MGLRWSYLETVDLSFIFTWNDGEIEDRPKFSRHLFFKKLLINNIELRDISTKKVCMTIPIWLKKLQRNWKSKIRMFRDYLVHRLYLQKINLKRPLSRGSRFKIYFRLECRRNWGSRQNFHGIPIFRRVFINKPESLRNDTKIYYDILILKIKQFNSKHECQNMRNINLFVLKNTTRVSIFCSWLAFFFSIFFL